MRSPAKQEAQGRGKKKHKGNTPNGGSSSSPFHVLACATELFFSACSDDTHDTNSLLKLDNSNEEKP